LAKNIIDRAPVYCDIGRLFDDVSHCVRSLNHLTVTRIQAGLNVAIPACSLCINQRLYKIATIKAVHHMITNRLSVLEANTTLYAYYIEAGPRCPEDARGA